MMPDGFNYGRFYGILKTLHCCDDEEMKESLVSQYTHGRTTSLREMTVEEYKAMCAGMTASFVQTGGRGYGRDELRRRRSIALHQMQKMGVDTTDWSRINALCRDGRIMGKEFRLLSADELTQLTTKLRVIERKGGFREHEECVEHATIVSLR